MFVSAKPYESIWSLSVAIIPWCHWSQELLCFTPLIFWKHKRKCDERLLWIESPWAMFCRGGMLGPLSLSVYGGLMLGESYLDGISSVFKGLDAFLGLVLGCTCVKGLHVGHQGGGLLA
jgi:hypothetical protein